MIFPGCGRREIGLKFVTQDKSPLLAMGITIASFQESGKVPVSTDKLNICVTCETKTFRMDLRVLLFKCVKPEDFLILIS